MGWHIMRRRHTCTLKEVKMQRMPGSETRGMASNVQRRVPDNSQGWSYSSVLEHWTSMSEVLDSTLPKKNIK